MGANRFYEEGEAEEILRRAIKNSDTARFDRDRLRSMASELGISDEALASAEEDLAREKQEQAVLNDEEALRKRWRSYRVSHFFGELFKFVGINALMIAIWYFAGRGSFWPGWILLFTAFGLWGDLSRLIAPSDSQFQKWRRSNVGIQFPREQRKEVFEYIDQMQEQHKALRSDSRGYVGPEGQRRLVSLIKQKFALTSEDAKDLVDLYFASSEP
jgi:hypothetical protein